MQSGPGPPTVSSVGKDQPLTGEGQGGGDSGDYFTASGREGGDDIFEKIYAPFR